MPELLKAFIVETSFRVPGLGVMALPIAPPPAWLATYALHTVLVITVCITGQPPQATTGTVEELLHASESPRRGLLLDFNLTGQLHIGTYLQARDELAAII